MNYFIYIVFTLGRTPPVAASVIVSDSGSVYPILIIKYKI